MGPVLCSLVVIATAAALFTQLPCRSTRGSILQALYRRAPDQHALPGSTQYRELPIGSIKSRGWIESQLQTSLHALGGQQQRFYSFVKDGTFTGGNSTYSDLHEAQPYYWTAAVAAVATTEAPASLQRFVNDTLEYVVSHQASDGFFGPEPRIAWPRWLFLNGVTHYCEAFAAACPLEFIYRFVNYTHVGLKTGDIEKADMDVWSGARTASYVQTLQWLFEYHPRDDAMQAKLLDSMALVTKIGALAVPDYNNSGWEGFFGDHFFTGTQAPQIMRTHGVNVGMALKDAPLSWRTTGDAKQKAAARRNWNLVYQYHGKVAGHFAADEHLAGFEPSRGAETCQIVETMWSSSITYATFGDAQDAERAERLAFNSLPAAMTGDWWGRQYLQQENQVNSMTFGPAWPFYTDSNNSNVFGLQSNYPCCTVNHPQGLPRFVSRAFLRGDARTDVDLLHVYYVPSEVSTILGKGNKVKVRVDTEYPYEDAVRYTITSDAAFVLGLRIPSWTTGASIAQDGKKARRIPSNVDVYKVTIPAGATRMTLELPSDLVAVPTPGGRGARNVAVFKGPLMFALPLAYSLEEKQHDATQPLAVDNWRLRKDNEGYLYAIDTKSMTLVRRDFGSGGALPQSTTTIEGLAPLAADVQGCRIASKAFGVINDGQYIIHFPPSDATCNAPREPLRLELYSAAKLHMGSLAALA